LACAAVARAPASRTGPGHNIDLQVPIWTIDHVAAALHTSVDTAREYTYRTDFPAPKAPFARNLWARAEVLAWFHRLPPPGPSLHQGRHQHHEGRESQADQHRSDQQGQHDPGAGPGHRHTGRPRPRLEAHQVLHAAERPTSAVRSPGAATVGVVRVLEPNAKGYYRLKWTEPDGTPGDTSAGKIHELALEKAEEINDRVTSAAGPKAVTALDAVVAATSPPATAPTRTRSPGSTRTRTRSRTT